MATFDNFLYREKNFIFYFTNYEKNVVKFAKPAIYLNK